MKKGFVINAIKFGGVSTINHIGFMFKAFLMAVAMWIISFLVVTLLTGFIGGALAFIFSPEKEFLPMLKFGGNVGFYLGTNVGYPIIYLWIELGFLQIAFDIVRRGTSTVGRMLIDISVFVRILVASCIFGLIAFCGLLLFIIPGIIVLIRGQFFAALILDKNVTITDSLKQSFAITKGHAWSLLGWNILASVLSFFFLIFGWQFYALSQVYVYYYLLKAYHERDHFVEPIAE